MAFIPVPDTIAVEFRMLWDTQKVENTAWFFNGFGQDAGTLETLLNELTAWWVDEYAPLIVNDVTLTGVYGRIMDTPTSPALLNIDGLGTAGGIDGSANPNNVSFAIQFGTGIPGRSFRGRNYIVGIDENAVTANAIAAATANAFVAAYTALGAAAAVAGQQWVVASRFTAGAPRTTGITTPVETASYVDLIVDSQRRRLPGRGE